MGKWIPDVSEHQGKINWEKLAGKIPGAVIRIGYGDDIASQDDKYAAHNLKECRRLGIPFAVYLYSHAKTDKQIQSEIAHTKRMCKGYEPIAYWLDLEERSVSNSWHSAAKAWREAFGDKAGVYSWEWAFKEHIPSNLKRWIAAYGKNTGKPDTAYKPKTACDGWQFTSRGRLDGIKGNVDLSEWYTEDFGKAVEIKPSRRCVTKKEVAAIIMRHLCTHSAHGYTQDMSGRQGTGTETIDIYGRTYTIKGGDRDCSSAVISAYEAAGISCGGATYTGNMSKCMTGTGNFVRRSMKFTAQMGDCYLSDKCHTAMCMSAEPDVLAEFSINEHGKALGGKVGDQKQTNDFNGESHLAYYYDYPWDCILQCINEEIAFIVEPDGTITEPDKDDGFTADGKTETKEETVPVKIAVLAVRTMRGDYGSNSERRQRLGQYYDAVQAIINRA